ncbi:hypothetical protein MOQ72_41400 [Saccharopolyspora sp. K220]|uniref:hypothetical protein n=1 Tax=Saccharopolyspora soli TaxID=2926618 RepID=UPI001F56FB32|nr:hypothetical protein [Saccharopolyspora soli]MCI2423877.1 hypothetical protein [Saccharopolyspora soli]
MSESPYEVALRVADAANDLDLHDLAEDVVEVVLALPNVVVLEEPDSSKGRAQVEDVAQAIHRDVCGCADGPDLRTRKTAEVAIKALRGGFDG